MVTGANELAKYWPPLNFSGSTFNGQLSYYSFIFIEGIYFHLASTPMLRFVAARIPSLKPQFSQLNPVFFHGFKAAMESPSTKRAYAATLAASLGVANEEVGVGSIFWLSHHPWSFQKNVDLTPSKTVMCWGNPLGNRWKWKQFGFNPLEMSQKWECPSHYLGTGCLPQDQIGQLAKWRYKAKHFMGK